MNILFLISDDHSASDLGCYGNPVRTPNLDALAREGMRFNNAFVTSPQCSPSRSSIFTGRSPHAIGTSRLHAPIRPEIPTIIDALKERDYFTGIYRKVHAGSHFQDKLDFYGDRQEKFSTFFDRVSSERPVFLEVGFHDPHRVYKPGAISPPHDPGDVVVPPFLPDTPEVRRDIALYYDEISRMDRECGEILGLLEDRGLAANTLVVFTSDHGMPFPRAKGSLYDAGIRAPLIVRWPGHVKPESATDELVSLADLPATWLEIAGAKPLPAMEGKSLVELLEGKTNIVRETIFAERNWHDNWDPMRCVRTARYKLIQNYRPEIPYRPSLDLENSLSWQSYLAEAEAGRLTPELQQLVAPARPQVELYDLEKDPDEFNNLAYEKEMGPVIEDLQKKLSNWMLDTNDFLPPPIGAIRSEHYRRRNPL